MKFNPNKDTIILILAALCIYLFMKARQKCTNPGTDSTTGGGNQPPEEYMTGPGNGGSNPYDDDDPDHIIDFAAPMDETFDPAPIPSAGTAFSTADTSNNTGSVTYSDTKVSK